MNIEGGIFYFNFLRRKFVIFFVFSVYIILDGGGEQDFIYILESMFLAAALPLLSIPRFTLFS